MTYEDSTYIVLTAELLNIPVLRQCFTGQVVAGCSGHQETLAQWQRNTSEDLHFQLFEESKYEVRRQRNTQQWTDASVCCKMMHLHSDDAHLWCAPAVPHIQVLQGVCADTCLCTKLAGTYLTFLYGSNTKPVVHFLLLWKMNWLHVELLCV